MRWIVLCIALTGSGCGVLNQDLIAAREALARAEQVESDLRAELASAEGSVASLTQRITTLQQVEQLSESQRQELSDLRSKLRSAEASASRLREQRGLSARRLEETAEELKAAREERDDKVAELVAKTESTVSAIVGATPWAPVGVPIVMLIARGMEMLLGRRRRSA